MFPEDHRLFEGFLPIATAELSKKLEGYDLIIVIGAPVFRYYMQTPGNFLPEGASVLHITNDLAEASRARHRELITVIDGGMNRAEASRHMGLPLRTVQRWLSYGVFPERKQRVYPSIVDAYGAYLEKRYTGGCRQITLLWQEVQRMGFEGQASAVRHWLRQRFGSPKDTRKEMPSKRSPPVSPQQVAWLMRRTDPIRHGYLKKLYRQSPEIASLCHVARELFEIIRTHHAVAWPRRLEKLKLYHWLPSREDFGEISARFSRHSSCRGATAWSNDRSTG